MFKFLRKTLLWIILLPLAASFLGTVSNQLVLNANNDTFPVRENNAKIAYRVLRLEELAQSKDPRVAEEARFRLLALSHGYIDSTHVVMTDETHLNWLADIIDFHTATYSVGDMLIELGDWSFEYASILWLGAVASRLYRKTD